MSERAALPMLVAGFSVWSVAFVVLYGLQALGCAYGWGEWHRPVLIAGYVLSLAALAWIGWPRASAPRQKLETAALWANRAALLAGALVFLPVTFASACL